MMGDEIGMTKLCRVFFLSGTDFVLLGNLCVHGVQTSGKTRFCGVGNSDARLMQEKSFSSRGNVVNGRCDCLQRGDLPLTC